MADDLYLVVEDDDSADLEVNTDPAIASAGDEEEPVALVLASDPVIELVVSEADPVSMEISESIVSGDTSPYTGEYEFTPSTESQTVLIKGLRATANIVINPIPQTYGLVTWDGSTLTIS